MRRQYASCFVAMLFVVLGLPLFASARSSLGCGWEGEFSLLYWRPTASELPLATAVALQNDGPRAAVYLWPAHYDLGYRAGLRYRFPCGTWYSRAVMTWLDARHTESKTPLPGEDSVLNDSFGVQLSSLFGRSHIRYVTGDLELGHPVALCQCVGLSALGGIRITKIDVDSALEGNVFGTTVPVTVHDQIHQRFLGVGPRLGLELRWCISRCWEAVGRLGSSFLFTTRSTAYENSADPGSFSLTNVSNINSPTWQLDGKLGLQFHTRWQCLGTLMVEGGIVLEHLLRGPNTMFQGFIVIRPQPQSFAIGGPYGRIALAF